MQRTVADFSSHSAREYKILFRLGRAVIALPEAKRRGAEFIHSVWLLLNAAKISYLKCWKINVVRKRYLPYVQF